MREITYAAAIRQALREEMLRNKEVILLGEDIGAHGGAFRVTQGLYEEFGPDRVIDTPISEAGIVGAAGGASLLGMRPVVEIMLAELLTLASDQIVNFLAKACYISGGQLRTPVVVRSPQGFYDSFGPVHSACAEGWFMNVTGTLAVAVPSTPYDAKGLMKTALRSNYAVLFLEHKMLYALTGPVPDEDYTVPFGEGIIRKEGDDVTIVATSLMVHRSMAAAECLSRSGVSCEVVDPRTLVPLDKESIINSVQKTGRLVVVEEGCKTCGVGAEIAATVAEEAIDYLKAPVIRVSSPKAPMPYSPYLEKLIPPDETRIVEGVERAIRH